MNTTNALSERIIGCAMEVHKILGPGMLETAYEECLCYELKLAGFIVRRQVPVYVIYKEIRLECAYRMDILVNEEIVIELKAVEEFHPVHQAQILTYMRFAKKKLGLLINFNVPVLKMGLRRFIY